ncbi:GPN-loop GTPase 2 [Cryptotermes secundus]|uniref:GPN-loop GTPase 2 n=1 Tax=Cryptotermes secundus TaxID=105785 RepID=A0A2J7R3D9_9NEOP|nr:GPN-loop GTPase 2 [Cryptotermes secundus]XP_023705878.1 GPN-loop GTPase 2 [Cryptotermes secundus]XP_033607028.1 GPN-loop GTPase 2 [Cryptotermes secundus]PNF35351.1 GPN-loop GTPase 2 [Cryptotermes secundus]PNF35353.1 GPN-loop GTPase 2 [Cryptotermes secundus]PNF35354.1 GPN-loop GTPase 2 [Cryptotermes secundus]PNF35356.1 GPN-loop GTPase 2 [Cryptotermes secundus]
MNRFGQLIIGPPGSGKTTYCHVVSKFLESIGRKVAVINVDPANDMLIYKAAVDISQLIKLEDAMSSLTLGPNGGLMFCMEFLEKNMDWLLQQLSNYKDHYFLFDCPGQVELYTHHNSMKNITANLVKYGLHLCSVHLVDAHYCSDPGKFISALLLSLSTMLQMELPHINVLSKIDLMVQYGKSLQFGIDFYTEVLDLGYLLECLDENPITHRYKKLNAALVSLVEDYSLVTFIPLNINDQQCLLRLKNTVDKANGYIFGSGEERSVQALLSSAVGAEYEHERTGFIRDTYSDDTQEHDADSL